MSIEIQAVIDQAVQIATRAALSGCPVIRIIWVPPATGSQSTEGTFVVEYPRANTGSTGAY